MTFSTLWDFCLGLYAQESIRNVCLRFQDEIGINVNLLLFLAYLSKNNLPINKAQLEFLLDQIKMLDEATCEFRQYRRALKNNDITQYKAALAKELEMEKEIQRTLIKAYNKTISSQHFEEKEHAPLSFDEALKQTIKVVQETSNELPNDSQILIDEMTLMVKKY